MKHIVIIGCGAAGMAAAISAAESNRKASGRSFSNEPDKARLGRINTTEQAFSIEDDLRVTVLEKNDRPGKKIYITGKGRCNVTNACETSEYFDHVVRGKKFLYSAVYGYDAACVQRFFEENGCPLKTERGARVFPVSDHSSDIIATLVKKMKTLGVQIRYGAEVRRILLEKIPDDGNCIDDNSLQAGNNKKPVAQRSEVCETSKENQTLHKHNFNESTQNRKRVTGVQLATGEVIEANAVIIATGGLSYPTTGSTGDGYLFAKAAGHTVEKCVPSLVPFEVREKWCTDLQGLALKNVRLYTEVSAAAAKTSGTGKPPKQGRTSKKRLFDEQGEMLFTHFGISGPLVLTAGTVYEQGTVLPMFIDLKPALTQEQLIARIERDFETQRDKQFKNAIGGLFPHSLIPVMVMLAQGGYDRINQEIGYEQATDAASSDNGNKDQCVIRPDEKVAGIGKKQIAAFARLIKRVPLTVIGTRSFREAIVTRGGVNLKEIDPSTMQSKLCNGLYFAGEVIDADAVTGGYNLQIAWSTGHLAGTSAAQEHL